MRSLFEDLRFGIRSLLKRPGFTLVAVITLALGIGATTAIFSVVHGLLLRPLPYRDDQRLVTLGQSNRKIGVAREGVSPANFLDWHGQAKSFAGVAAAEQWGFTLTGYGEPEAMRGWVVTKGFFEILGVNALIGRTLLPEEYEQEKPVVVISYGLWQRRFGGDPQILGRQLTLNKESMTVVGVMPAEFDYPPPNREVWGPRRARPNDSQMRGGSLFRVIARLRAGVTAEQAQQEMNGIAAQLGQQYPQTNGDVGAVVVPLREQLVGQVRLSLYILFGAVGLVLLIACANVASLLLVRAAERQREFAVRAALGASGRRLLKQLLTESVLLSLLGGLGGLLVSTGLIKAIVAMSPGNLPMAQVRLNPIVLLFAVAVSLLTSLIFGLVPAIQASRTDLQKVFSSGGRTASGGRGRQRIRQTLVISEIALALIVLVGAGLLARSFVALLHTDPGFTPDKGLALEVQLGTLSVPERTLFVDQVLDKVSAVPGVQAVAVSSALPFHDNQVALPSPIKLNDRPTVSGGNEPVAFMVRVSEDYFGALGIPLLHGRFFGKLDRANTTPVALVNETMARRLWPAETPIGRKISFTALGQNATAEIIGVVGSVRPTGFDSEPRPEFYLHYPQSPASLVTIFVRTPGDPPALLSSVKAKIREVNPNQAFLSVHTIAQLVDKTTAQRQFNLVWLGAFAVAALILATVGLYGLISFSTTQRTKEIGVRMALGAQPGDVLKLVMREGIRLALIGVALGFGIVVAASSLMKSLLFGISVTDPVTFASIPVLLMLVAMLACYIPARRATKVDPTVALRYE
jgi:putative ABC transport system permease protein